MGEQIIQFGTFLIFLCFVLCVFNRFRILLLCVAVGGEKEEVSVDGGTVPACPLCLPPQSTDLSPLSKGLSFLTIYSLLLGIAIKSFSPIFLEYLSM